MADDDRTIRAKRRGLPVPRKAGVFLGIAALVILLVFAFADLTDREVVLLGFFQTILSLAAGWAITHVYAEDSLSDAISEVEEIYQRNLKTYALKAAEKVENLSMQLNGLASYLNDELEENSYASVAEELSAKEERIYSAVHLLNVLKSVNDTALSDWRGVIGEELERRQEAAVEREEDLERILEQLMALEQREDGPASTGADPEAAALRQELDSMREEIRKLARSSGIPLTAPRKASRWPVEKFAAICPSCGEDLVIAAKSKPGVKKAVNCKTCDTDLIFYVLPDGVGGLHERRQLNEELNCPKCANGLHFVLDEWIGSTKLIQCDSCGQEVRVSRASSGVRATLARSATPHPSPLTPEFIESVRQQLPEQPWPKAIHRAVAETLGATPSQVQRAIRELIASGEVMDQFEGVLCSPEERLRMMQARASAETIARKQA